MPLLLHVLYTTIEGKRDEFFDLINRLEIPQKSRAEEDNYQYDYFIPYGTTNKLFLVELWKTKEGFEKHKKMPHFLELQNLKGEYIEGSKLDIYEID